MATSATYSARTSTGSTSSAARSSGWGRERIDSSPRLRGRSSGSGSYASTPSRTPAGTRALRSHCSTPTGMAGCSRASTRALAPASTPSRSAAVDPTVRCRTRNPRRSSRRWPDSLGVTGVGDGSHMAPIVDPRTPPVTRPTVRARRRGPAPLEQIPAWRELVPVMDPSIATPPVPEGMDGLLGGLDPDQLRAVTHDQGPLLVVAGAGTGKTQVITRRIAWLIATRRAKPSEILALTFTDKAADEMAVRVDQLVPYGYTDTQIATFHAFGDRVIREHALQLGLAPDVRVLSRAEAVIFLREHLFEFDLDAYRPLGDPTHFLAALVSLFSRCKDEDISPQTYAAHAGRVALEAAALAEAAGAAEPVDPAATDAASARAEDARRQGERA